MKSLIVFRHAEAENHQAGGTDMGRKLTETGLIQAKSQGGLLRQAGVMPERIVASSAVRTLETANAIVEGGDFGLEVEPEETLYNAPGTTLLEFIRGMPNTASMLMMVAHIPGVAELVSMLTTENVDLAQMFPPGTLAGVAVEGESWEDFDYGTGTLTLFLPPILKIF